MTWFLVAMLSFLCLALAAWGLKEKSHLLQFPFLSAVAVAIQFIPAILVLGKPDNLDSALGENALNRVVAMAILCLLMTAFGYFVKTDPPKVLLWQVQTNRFLTGATFLVIASVFFGFLLSRLPAEELGASQWSGRPVFYLFFASVGVYGATVALLVFTKTWDKRAFVLMIPWTISSLSLMIFYGRRGVTAAFCFAIACALWFNRKWMLPRSLAVVVILGFAVYSAVIGDYRRIMKDDSSDKINNIKGINVAEKLEEEGIRNDQCEELKNAAYIMAAYSKSGRYDLGVTFYNAIIGQYVPRQLVGEEFKKALMGVTPDEVVKDEYNYSFTTGSCHTGVADVFASFWYFGSLVFFVIGYVMRRIWEGAERGYIVHQFLYVNMLALILGVFNGDIASFITPWIHILVFAGPVFVFARDRMLECKEQV